MINHILITFSTSKPLPADASDMIADRIYKMDIVTKGDFTASILTQSQVDLLNGVYLGDIPAILKRQAS